MGKTQTKVHQSRNQQTSSHKTIDIATVGKKTIRKFTEGIGKKQYGTDYAEFRFRKNTLIHNRFLYDIQAKTANVVHTVTESG